MKKITIILFLIAIAIAAITCKKTPEIPSGNKIEIGQSTTDSLSYFTAKVSTTITATGGNEISQHGHCWNTAKEPTIENQKTNLGELTQPKSYSSELTNLTNNTTYYVRPYITYANGIVYGSEQSIQTLVTGKPIVTTNEVANILTNSAICGGTNDDGGLTISQRGVCWNTTSNPTLENNIGLTSDGTSTESFASEITNLIDGTTYYVAAYATNVKGTGYGEQKDFQTIAFEGPTVSTTTPTNITGRTVTSGGNVTSDGGANVTARGVCWSASSNPTISDNITTDGTGVGVFTSDIIGLTGSTQYYVRAYATNTVGTSYGNEISFTTLDACNGIETITYEGQTYNTVVIGDQCWMAENLNYNTGNSWCYDNNSSNCDTYGRLYDWETIMNGESSSSTLPSGVQGICPDSWHLPSDAEWTVLTRFLGGNDAGGKMKEEGYDHWNEPNTGATNSSGFTALPGGIRAGHDGHFGDLGSGGYWCSATECSSTYTWIRNLFYGFSVVIRPQSPKENSQSVRCVRD